MKLIFLMFTAFIQEEVNLKKVNKTALGVSKLIRTMFQIRQKSDTFAMVEEKVCVWGGRKQKLLMERLGEGEEENNR